MGIGTHEKTHFLLCRCPRRKSHDSRNASDETQCNQPARWSCLTALPFIAGKFSNAQTCHCGHGDERQNNCNQSNWQRAEKVRKRHHYQCFRRKCRYGDCLLAAGELQAKRHTHRWHATAWNGWTQCPANLAIRKAGLSGVHQLAAGFHEAKCSCGIYLRLPKPQHSGKNGGHFQCRRFGQQSARSGKQT